MNIVDAGVVVELAAGNLDPNLLGAEDLAAPHLIDSEVTNVLRRLVRHGNLTGQQGGYAMDGFLGLSLTRYPADWLRPRMWELLDNVTAYDATYLALAELTRATALLTTDLRLAEAPGIRCRVVVL